MRVTPSKHSSGFLLALLTALLVLAPSGEASAQSTSRSFQMALYVDYSVPPTVLTRADADIPMFGEGQPQPAGRSIMKFKSWPTGPTLSIYGYDWTRIVAAVVDEPYTYFFNNNENSANPCASQRLNNITQTTQLLRAAAAALKSVAPWARFWVIFTPAEVDWMMEDICPETRLNQPYIDVIALDDYRTEFSPTIKTYYDWLATYPATPAQQLALIPGTFYQGQGNLADQIAQAKLLQGYFDYASANQRCNLSLGTRGVTGSYDGCLIWMVLGWTGPNGLDNNGNVLYFGELDPSSTFLANAWRNQVKLPVQHGLSYELTHAQIVSTLIQQWLAD